MNNLQEENIEFVDQWADAIDRTNPTDAQLAAEAEVINFATEIDDKEVALTALSHLVERLKHEQSQARVSRLIGEARFGAKSLIEVPAYEIPLAIDRLLEGKNPALVVRNGGYENFDKDILGSLADASHATVVGTTEHFPNEAMRLKGKTDSDLHLDMFLESKTPGYRYTLSAAKVEAGEVLFVGGIASKRTKGWDLGKYNKRQRQLNKTSVVARLYDQAKHSTSPSYREWRVHEPNLEVDMVAVTLHPGDVVVWPQGGPGTEAASWHGFRQVGTEARATSSYHLRQQTSANVIDLRD